MLLVHFFSQTWQLLNLELLNLFLFLVESLVILVISAEKTDEFLITIVNGEHVLLVAEMAVEGSVAKLALDG